MMEQYIYIAYVNCDSAYEVASWDYLKALQQYIIIILQVKWLGDGLKVRTIKNDCQYDAIANKGRYTVTDESKKKLMVYDNDKDRTLVLSAEHLFWSGLRHVDWFNKDMHQISMLSSPFRRLV